MAAGDGPQFIEVTAHQPARDPAAVIHIRDTKVEMDPNRILRHQGEAGVLTYFSFKNHRAFLCFQAGLLV